MPTLVLLPGLMCDYHVWSAQRIFLEDRCNCFIPKYEMLNSLSSMADHVLQSVENEKFSLAGHSMGGRVALEIMRLAPQRVTHLALLDTGTHALSPGLPGEQERSKRLALLLQATQFGMRSMGLNWAAPMVHPDSREGILFEGILDMLERSSPRQFQAQIEALLEREDSSPLLPNISCPTLVMCGRQDTWSSPEQHEVMAKSIPNSKIVVVENCGHMCTLEQPEVVNAALLNWLTS